MRDVLEALVGQQRNPVAFVRRMRVYPHAVWWPAWGLHAGMFLGSLGLLVWLGRGNAAARNQLALNVSAVWLLAQLLCTFPIMASVGPAQFWLLYTYSPFFIIMLLGSGLSALDPRWFPVVAGGLPFAVGKLVADAGALWVYRQAQEHAQARQRERPGGLPAELPALVWQRQSRRLRLLGAAAIVGALLYLYPETAPQTVGDYGLFAVALLSGVTGALSLEATALAWVGVPPARWDAEAQQWRVTYVGRTALVVPPARLDAVANDAAALIALLRDGPLGPALRRRLQRHAPPHLARLALVLSVQEGGGAALRYLARAWPPDARARAEFYAALAEEAARPNDLRRWLHVFAHQLPAPARLTIQEPVSADTLNLLHKALLTYTCIPELLEAIQALRQIEQLTAATTPSAWPAQLRRRMEQHHAQLCPQEARQ